MLPPGLTGTYSATVEICLSTCENTTHTQTLHHVFYFSAQTISWSILDHGPNRLNALWTSPKTVCSTELIGKAKNHRRHVPHHSQSHFQHLMPSKPETTEQNLVQDPGLRNTHTAEPFECHGQRKAIPPWRSGTIWVLWRDRLRDEILGTLLAHCIFSSCPGIMGLGQMFTREEAQLSFQAVYIQKTC